uniref:Uncharacterized protein n=1 Tax=Amphimedon queenslandica TaxID=400682 RepID=A0A1X7VT93_AMPQE
MSLLLPRLCLHTYTCTCLSGVLVPSQSALPLLCFVT